MKKDVIVECPICEHIQEEIVDFKTTAVCEECRWPYEVYEDGRIEPSALAHVRGPISVVDYRRWRWGLHHGHSPCMTLEAYAKRRS